MPRPNPPDAAGKPPIPARSRSAGQVAKGNFMREIRRFGKMQAPDSMRRGSAGASARRPSEGGLILPLAPGAGIV